MVNVMRNQLWLPLIILIGTLDSGNLSAYDLANPSSWENASSSGIDKIRSNASFCRKIALTEGEQKGTPVIAEFKEFTIEADSYMSMNAPAEIDWNIKLNQTAFEKKRPKGQSVLARNANLIFSLSDADCLLNMSPKAWQLFERESQKVIVKGPAVKGPLTNESLFKWFKTQLNYDAIVMGIEGDSILVAGYRSDLSNPGRKAIVISKSASSLKVDTSNTTGAALLSLKAHNGIFAIFKILRKEAQAEIAIGDKIILE